MCEKIYAGGDVPKDNFSFERTKEFQIPIYANGVGKNELYGYTNVIKISTACVTVSARGTIGYAVARNEPFFPIVRLLTLIPKDIIDYRYLSNAINSINFEKSGSSIPQLTIPQISDYHIPLPPLEVQQEIIEKLNEKNEYIQLTEKLINRQKLEMQNIISSLWKI